MAQPGTQVGWAVSWTGLRDRGKHVLAQRVERRRITKELGDPDQEVLVRAASSPGSRSINAMCSSKLSIRCSIMRRLMRRVIVVRL